jgi:hypothetical protein
VAGPFCRSHYAAALHSFLHQQGEDSCSFA